MNGNGLFVAILRELLPKKARREENKDKFIEIDEVKNT